MRFLSWPGLGGFSQGIHPPEYKAETASKPIRRLPFAPTLILPLSQHIGAPSRPIVNVGQEVVRGEMIAEAVGQMSIPVHAPASGVIKAIDLMPGLRGSMQKSIVLRVYEGSTQEILWGQPRDMSALSPEEIIQAVQDTGMAGLGGAAFPTHVKFKVPREHKVHTLVVNGCECEPFLSTDHRVMLEHPEALIRGIYYAMRATGTKKAIVGIESNKRDAAKVIRNLVAAEDDI